MKKGIKAIFITLIVVTVLLTFVVFVTAIRPNWFGEFGVNLYRDITSEYGKTVADFYTSLASKMLIVSGVFYVFIFGFSIACLATIKGEKKLKKEVDEVVKKEVKKAEEKKEAEVKKDIFAKLKEKFAPVKKVVTIKKKECDCADEVEVTTIEVQTPVVVKKEVSNSVSSFLDSIK